ncbi:MAG TPA: recombinase family protein [Syntrophomonadaceae bacterium]|nr:recombinase family protein [Syntrophomonadaceae bacterium]
MIAIYARVSTGLQVTEGTSLDGQIELCLKKAFELGFTKDEVKIYKEEGMTGEDIDRPTMNRLRTDVSLGFITHVICTHPDRLSRDLTDKLIVCREFEKHGVRLVFVDTEYRNTPEGQLFFNMQSVIAQYELSQIKKRTIRGRLDTVRKKQKVMPMRVPPFGYDLTDGRLVINEREAEFVKMIYNWYVFDRLTMRQIGEKLCALGCYPKRGENKYWNASSIRRILTSEIYVGRYYYNRRRFHKLKGEKTAGGKPRRKYEYRDRSEWIEVEVPAIIDEALFEMAQQQKIRNRKILSGHIRHDYLLRSLLKCGKCGHAWVSTTYPGDHGKTYPVYRCNNKYPRKFGSKEVGGCDTRTIRADMLDGYVWNQIKELVLNPELFLKAAQKQGDAAAAALRKTLDAVDKQIEVKEKEKEKIKRMFVLETISEDEMRSDVARVNQEIERLQAEAKKYKNLLNARRRNLRSIDIVNRLINTIKHGIESEEEDKKALLFREKRNIIEMLVSEIIVEFQGEEVILTYMGILDELLKKKLIEYRNEGVSNNIVSSPQHQKI